MMCTWWTHPNRMTAMVERVPSRTSLLRHHQSIDVSDAAQNHAAKRTAIPALERIILWITPKTKKPLSRQHPNMMIGRMVKLTPMIPSGMMARRIVTTYRSPKRMRASATKTSSYQRNPSNKSVLSAG